MGEHDVRREQDQSALRRFTRQLIQDVRALEYMLHHDLFETDVRRVGAEQELFMVDGRWQPAPIIEEVLAANTDPRLVSELAKFNLEFNLDPLTFEGDCLAQMEAQIVDLLAAIRELVGGLGAEVVMTGILPTIHLSDLTLEHITPNPRYHALNEVLARLRGGPVEFHIRGVDELFVKHDSITLEACNTSFQTHFQVSPDEFARYYNVAQAVAAPVLAAAVNSPVLFGKRLWQETRIALFQQAVDTRSSNLYLREMSPRVHFGTGWVRESVLEIFKEDISRFRVLLTAGEVEDPFAALEEGRAPELRALQLHNGTVYRWNRACYGILEGRPHLRIENRILPAGPTPLDEVANAAFWFGLVGGLANAYDDVTGHMDFDDAKSNFVASARLGLASQITWMGSGHVPAHDLIREELLPMAREGLSANGIRVEDIDRYLGVIEERVASRQTGAQWILTSIAQMKQKKAEATRAERLNAVVGAMVERQKSGAPVHEWAPAGLDEGSATRRLQDARVEQFMSTDLFTVNEDELVELVACLMDWQRIRHVLVENNQHQLVGLVTHRTLLRYLAEYGPSKEGEEGMAVHAIMIKNPISVPPEATMTDAVSLMRAHRIGALPVVREGQLMGLLTEQDLVSIAGTILDERLPAAPEAEAPTLEPGAEGASE